MPKVVQRREACDPISKRTAPPLPPGASAGKRWRFRRNLVIYTAHRSGLSQRLLADVFDLPRSRIAEIIREVGAYDGGSPDT